MTGMETILLRVLAGWNLITFAVTVSDKIAAKRKRRRVPEKVFLLFASFCGGEGVLTAFYMVRHKTRHRALLIKTWLLTTFSYTVLALAIWLSSQL